MLSYSGLGPSDFHIHNVKLLSSENHIRTIEIGDVSIIPLNRLSS